MRSSRRALNAVLAAAGAAALAATGLPAHAAEAGHDRLPAGLARQAGAAALPTSPSAHSTVVDRTRRQTAAAIAEHISGRTRVVVRTSSTTTLRAQLRALQQRSADVSNVVPPLHAVSLMVPSSQLRSRMRHLRQQPGVLSVTRATRRTLSDFPNDPDWSQQSLYYDNVNAPAAWDVTHGSSSVTVAVVDSGVDVSHPDLVGKIAGKYNANTGSTTVTDSVGHGTFIAGEIGANTGNAAGVAAAGYDTSILAVKVADSAGDIYTDTEADGIVWATDHGARIINLSLGGSADNLETAAVQYAQDKGVLVVSAAGNDGTSAKSYPAALPGVLSVGGTVGTSRASFSNYGDWVDVGAPAVNIFSTTPVSGSADFDAGYSSADGTSFSSPLVAAEAALLAAEMPTATASTLQTAIVAGTTGAYGFKYGRVDFKAALDALPPTTVPIIDAPDNGAQVGGLLHVAVTSTAPRIQVSLPGVSPVQAAVVGGTAAVDLPTYGLSGPRTLTVVDCSTSGVCGGSGAARDVSVTNPVPTLTGPASGVTVGDGGIHASATAVGGGVAFFVDSTRVAFDASAPYALTVPTAGLANGSHELTAELCSATGSVCDHAHPSVAVTFSVKLLHPTIRSAGPSPFSPNGDSVKDSLSVAVRADQRETVTLSVLKGSTIVRRVRLNGGKPVGAGTHEWTWNGKNASGQVVSSGSYVLRVDATAKTGTGSTLTGHASRSIAVDRSKPGLSNASAGGTFFPVRDGYKDSLHAAVSVSESAALRLEIFDASGHVRRSISGGRVGPGHRSVTWDGKLGGRVASPGKYSWAFTATDSAGNHRQTSKHGVTVSGKQIEKVKASRTMTPKDSRDEWVLGDCSDVAVPAPKTGWTGSFEYLSMIYFDAGYSCDYFSDTTDLAASGHAFTLPKALGYSGITVAAVGRSDPEFSDQAGLGYFDSSGDVADEGRTLKAGLDTYTAPSVGPGYLRNGRTLRWWAATTGHDWYQIKTFTVTWHYFALR